MNAGLEAALKRGRKGGRHPVITQEKIEAIKEALEHWISKAAIGRMFAVKRSSLYHTLNRVFKES